MSKHTVRYMCRRGSIFQLRVSIPKDLHHRFARKELRWSLQTVDRKIARRRTLRASLAFDELCDTIRVMNELSHSKIKILVQELFDALVSEHKLPPAIHASDMEFEDHHQIGMGEEMARELAEQIETRDYSEGIRTEVALRLKARKVEFYTLGPNAQAGLLEGLVRAKIEYIRYAEHRRKRALETYFPQDQMFISPELQSIAKSQSTKVLTNQPMPLGEGGSVSDRIELYLEEGGWIEKTKDEKIGVLN